MDDDYKYDVFEAYLEIYSFSDWENRVDSRGSRWDDDIYLYRDRDMEEVAYDLMHDIYEIPDYLENYIDYSSYARDLSYDGFHETSKGVIEIR